MTITYSYSVANASMGGFGKLLFRWKGSIYKLMYREMLIFVGLYFFLSSLYRWFLTDFQKRIFEKIALYCHTYTDLIPLSFVFGFYVALIVGRWWQQYNAIPWPDTLMLKVGSYVLGDDERGQMIRRTLMRYVNLMLVLTLQGTSISVKKRFPTLDHLVEAGLMTKEDLRMMDSIPNAHGKWWFPSIWFSTLAVRARKENRIRDDFFLDRLIKDLDDFRGKCGLLFAYDWISVPLVYTQVATLALYTFFLATLMGRQYLEPGQNIPGRDVDLYIPFFTILQFFFYMGWLKVAEQLINPFGEDDDDFEMNWIIDRNLQASYMACDAMYNKLPKLQRDYYWGEIEFSLPYTKAITTRMTGEPFMGSTMNLDIPVEDMSFVPMETILEADTNEDEYDESSNNNSDDEDKQGLILKDRESILTNKLPNGDIGNKEEGDHVEEKSGDLQPLIDLNTTVKGSNASSETTKPTKFKDPDKKRFRKRSEKLLLQNLDVLKKIDVFKDLEKIKLVADLVSSATHPAKSTTYENNVNPQNPLNTTTPNSLSLVDHNNNTITTINDRNNNSTIEKNSNYLTSSQTPSSIIAENLNNNAQQIQQNVVSQNEPLNNNANKAKINTTSTLRVPSLSIQPSITSGLLSKRNRKSSQNQSLHNFGVGGGIGGSLMPLFHKSPSFMDGTSIHSLRTGSVWANLGKSEHASPSNNRHKNFMKNNNNNNTSNFGFPIFKRQSVSKNQMYSTMNAGGNSNNNSQPNHANNPEPQTTKPLEKTTKPGQETPKIVDSSQSPQIRTNISNSISTEQNANISLASNVSGFKRTKHSASYPNEKDKELFDDFSTHDSSSLPQHIKRSFEPQTMKQTNKLAQKLVRNSKAFLLTSQHHNHINRPNRLPLSEKYDVNNAPNTISSVTKRRNSLAFGGGSRCRSPRPNKQNSLLIRKLNNPPVKASQNDESSNGTHYNDESEISQNKHLTNARIAQDSKKTLPQKRFTKAISGSTLKSNNAKQISQKVSQRTENLSLNNTNSDLGFVNAQIENIDTNTLVKKENTGPPQQLLVIPENTTINYTDDTVKESKDIKDLELNDNFSCADDEDEASDSGSIFKNKNVSKSFGTNIFRSPRKNRVKNKMTPFGADDSESVYSHVMNTAYDFDGDDEEIDPITNEKYPPKVLTSSDITNISDSSKNNAKQLNDENLDLKEFNLLPMDSPFFLESRGDDPKLDLEQTVYNNVDSESRIKKASSFASKDSSSCTDPHAENQDTLTAANGQTYTEALNNFIQNLDLNDDKIYKKSEIVSKASASPPRAKRKSFLKIGKSHIELPYGKDNTRLSFNKSTMTTSPSIISDQTRHNYGTSRIKRNGKRYASLCQPNSSLFPYINSFNELSPYNLKVASKAKSHWMNNDLLYDNMLMTDNSAENRFTWENTARRYHKSLPNTQSHSENVSIYDHNAENDVWDKNLNSDSNDNISYLQPHYNNINILDDANFDLEESRDRRHSSPSKISPPKIPNAVDNQHLPASDIMQKNDLDNEWWEEKERPELYVVKDNYLIPGEPTANEIIQNNEISKRHKNIKDRLHNRFHRRRKKPDMSRHSLLNLTTSNSKISHTNSLYSEAKNLPSRLQTFLHTKLSIPTLFATTSQRQFGLTALPKHQPFDYSIIANQSINPNASEAENNLLPMNHPDNIPDPTTFKPTNLIEDVDHFARNQMRKFSNYLFGDQENGGDLEPHHSRSLRPLSSRHSLCGYSTVSCGTKDLANSIRQPVLYDLHHFQTNSDTQRLLPPNTDSKSVLDTTYTQNVEPLITTKMHTIESPSPPLQHIAIPFEDSPTNQLINHNTIVLND